jgi:hypothetical protein
MDTFLAACWAGPDGQVIGVDLLKPGGRMRVADICVSPRCLKAPCAISDPWTG